MDRQRTIARDVSLSGIGLHTGMRVNATFRPAPPGTGVLFARTDLPGTPAVPADIEHVVDVRRGTTLGAGDARVHTVEHLLATLSGLGIDNLQVELDEREPPEGDGSSLPFLKALSEAGVVEQSEPKRYQTVREPVSVSRNGTFVVAIPADEFRISCTISYGKAALDAQYLSVSVTPESFREEICSARTFCFYDEVAELMERGLIRGGSLDNAVVIRDDAILSKESLRFRDEFVRHKILDIMGDLFLAGPNLRAHVVAIRPGHPPNVELARELKRHLMATEKVGGAAPRPVPTSGQGLDPVEVLNILPHRYPFLLIDRILEIDDKEGRIVGLKNVTFNEPYFQGHFPGHPIMPGVLQVEAMAQAVGILILRRSGNEGCLAYFMSIKNAKFRRAVRPGDQLLIEVTILKTRGRTAKVKGRITVDGEVASEAELMFSLVER